VVEFYSDGAGTGREKDIQIKRRGLQEINSQHNIFCHILKIQLENFVL
jgi:hypothetical protein